MVRKLIVSADDFGLTEGINSGIIKSAGEGIVTSASLMANVPAFEHAVALARSTPDLAIGVHLNLLKGRPLQPASKVRSLVNADGVFYTLPQFIPRLLFGRIDFAEVERELRSQIEWISATGLKVTHLDSHRHFHIYPSLLKLIVRLAREYQINRVRCPLGISVFPRSFKELLLNGFAQRARRMLDESSIGHNGGFLDLLKIETSSNSVRAFAGFCENLPPGVTELDCHPGFITDELNGIEATIHDRERQMEILTNPDILRLLQQYDIELVNYQDIK